MKTGTWLWMAALLGFGSLGLGGCGTDAVTPGGDVARLDEHRTLGAPVVAENLTVWPVYTDAALDIGEFRTLQEAQEKELAVVQELGGAGSSDAAQQREGQVVANDGAAAQVNKVVIENKGDLPILVCAGTIITGGKQDRQIGQDFVIAANSKVDVDAFCVEQGRWSTGAEGIEFSSFQSADLSTGVTLAAGSGGGAAAGLIAPKPVRAAGQYEKDQGKVWEKVAEELKTDHNFATPSSTFLAKVENAKKETVAHRARIEKRVAEAFAKLAASERKPVGFAYAVNGKPVTVRAFAHERILKSQLPAFLKAMALEAESAAGAEGATQTAKASDVIAMVEGLEKAKEELNETRAGNDNGYRSTDAAFNARCYLKKGFLKAVGPNKIIITEDWTRR